MIADSQIRSRSRVEQHGEVFTSEREVNAMLDLVLQETERIDSRFLEPACGTGNFLIEILCRKLKVVQRRYRKNQSDYEKYAFIAVSSLYGIDILEDNVIECRARLFAQFDCEYSRLFAENCQENFRDAIRFLLEKNILWGDALTLRTNAGKRIVFSEWAIVSDTYVKRRDFAFDEILAGHNKQTSLACFTEKAEYDTESQAFIPAPVAEFPLTDFTGVVTYE